MQAGRFPVIETGRKHQVDFASMSQRLGAPILFLYVIAWLLPPEHVLLCLQVCLLASIFCVTIVLGNLSLKYIPVSFNQAIGATTPFFTAIFAFILQGKCI